MSNLCAEIQSAINRCSAENGSNTPDFILAEYLVACLEAYNHAVRMREDWFGSSAQAQQLPLDLPGDVE